MRWLWWRRQRRRKGRWRARWLHLNARERDLAELWGRLAPQHPVDPAPEASNRSADLSHGIGLQVDGQAGLAVCPELDVLIASVFTHLHGLSKVEHCKCRGVPKWVITGGAHEHLDVKPSGPAVLQQTFRRVPTLRVEAERACLRTHFSSAHVLHSSAQKSRGGKDSSVGSGEIWIRKKGKNSSMQLFLKRNVVRPLFMLLHADVSRIVNSSPSLMRQLAASSSLAAEDDACQKELRVRSPC